MEATDTSLLERLSSVQNALKAPKSQFNSFGKYNYRNCEDILEAAKPLCSLQGLVLSLGDTLVQVGERYYVKATATVEDFQGHSKSVDGYAREEETKKGMDGSQITGAASSYARKYALNGLFLIDDTKDSDATNDNGKTPQKPSSKPETPPVHETMSQDQIVELMDLAKKKGHNSKDEAIAFLDQLAGGPFTKVPAPDFASFKKTVIESGWGKPESSAN